MALFDQEPKKPAGTFAINTNPVLCPKCGEPMPKMRKPTSLRQALLGGWTCAKCGTEMDRWGEPRKS